MVGKVSGVGVPGGEARGGKRPEAGGPGAGRELKFHVSKPDGGWVGGGMVTGHAKLTEWLEELRSVASQHRTTLLVTRTDHRGGKAGMTYVVHPHSALQKFSGLGAQVVINRPGSLVRVTAEAPAGMIWRASKVHELVAEERGGHAGAWADVRERMALGLEECDDTDCDWCSGS